MFEMLYIHASGTPHPFLKALRLGDRRERALNTSLTRRSNASSILVHHDCRKFEDDDQSILFVPEKREQDCILSNHYRCPSRGKKGFCKKIQCCRSAKGEVLQFRKFGERILFLSNDRSQGAMFSLQYVCCCFSTAEAYLQAAEKLKWRERRDQVHSRRCFVNASVLFHPTIKCTSLSGIARSTSSRQSK